MRQDLTLLAKVAHVNGLAATSRAALATKVAEARAEEAKVAGALASATFIRVDWERLRAEVTTRPEAATELAVLSEQVLTAFLEVITGFNGYVAILDEVADLSMQFGAMTAGAQLLGQTALTAAAETAPRV